MSAPHPNPAFLLLQASTAEALDRMLRAEFGDGDVHAARKALKRARAALRLLRPLLGERSYHASNVALRDAGRCLSPLRDARTMLTLIEEVDAAGFAIEHRDGIAGIRQAFAHRLDAAREAIAAPELRRDCAALVASTRRQVGRDLPAGNGEVLHEALATIYRKARKAYRRARDDGGAEILHEWRKQTKYLRAAQAALDTADADAMKKSDRQAERIADWLGDEHDLAVLAEMIGGPSENATGRLVAAGFARRRANLRRKALRKAEKLFAVKPRHYVARVLGSPD